MKTPAQLCALAPVIPVIIVNDVAQAAPLAKALVAGGLPVLEVTLRTPVALEAIAEMKAACPDAVVGAGTLRNAADVKACMDAGCAFGVSPGAPAALMDAVAEAGMPFLPGCATATEAMALADRGFEVVKFFPAGAAGGPNLLKSLASPLPDVKFCPTGGVSLENAPEYLKLPNVCVVGGSWVIPNDALETGDWARIEALARAAVTALRPLQKV
ncbi:bifunctional 4-hydroxy-2-oxoglutarate aldolase/2-dehydro-3-deoxy-phosphogluconate aldolase [Paroceanicella profunda]|uniref:2-dehydro-3-deoxy-phosphogluconate aldolase n=1 Tax=Paroceanicella profunda TaxID=2579971 RepID=A0A5B8FGU8_9RHOB|nr:bifunctional 4-hydroxy-2-oxoglutarate aldolase/2-dehydro-3-deoxy-phosphogluconate aldolase [Paroceanicella profunda]QDL91417.1 bifunctional 4-hydroxy-2-oxoglutarate aldolase/2-dehydro-3-deoxy-phosphogluconate aldolase [Paroceanicella profunda]